MYCLPAKTQLTVQILSSLQHVTMNASVLRQTSRAARAASRVSSSAHISRRCASSAVTYNWKDPLNSANLYTEDELAIQDTARQYCQEQLLPRVLGMRDGLR